MKTLAMLLALALCFALGLLWLDDKTDDKKADDKGAASKLKIVQFSSTTKTQAMTLLTSTALRKPQRTQVLKKTIIWKYSISEDENCFDAATDLVEQGCSYIISGQLRSPVLHAAGS